MTFMKTFFAILTFLAGAGAGVGIAELAQFIEDQYGVGLFPAFLFMIGVAWAAMVTFIWKRLS